MSHATVETIKNANNHSLSTTLTNILKTWAKNFMNIWRIVILRMDFRVLPRIFRTNAVSNATLFDIDDYTDLRLLNQFSSIENPQTKRSTRINLLPETLNNFTIHSLHFLKVVTSNKQIECLSNNPYFTKTMNHRKVIPTLWTDLTGSSSKPNSDCQVNRTGGILQQHNVISGSPYRWIWISITESVEGILDKNTNEVRELHTGSYTGQIDKLSNAHMICPWTSIGRNGRFLRLLPQIFEFFTFIQAQNVTCSS